MKAAILEQATEAARRAGHLHPGDSLEFLGDVLYELLPADGRITEEQLKEFGEYLTGTKTSHHAFTTTIPKQPLVYSCVNKRPKA